MKGKGEEGDRGEKRVRGGGEEGGGKRGLLWFFGCKLKGSRRRIRLRRRGKKQEQKDVEK